MFETDSNLSRPEDVSSRYRIYSYDLSCYTVCGTFRSKMNIHTPGAESVVFSFSAVLLLFL